MSTGRISKIVTSFGSRWGRVRAYGESQELFFNPQSLGRPEEFDDLQEGQEVEFDQEPDRANGSHAVRLVSCANAKAGLGRRAGASSITSPEGGIKALAPSSGSNKR
jgi:cold shock CspA family protein